MSRVGWLLLASVFFMGCEGDQGPAGTPGTPGTAAENCTLTDNGDGTATVACPGGTTVTIPTGGTGDGGMTDTTCTVTDNGDGTATVSCPGAADVTVPIASTTPPVVEPDLVGEPSALNVEITGVDTTAAPVVTFKVTNQDGQAFPLLTQETVTGRNMRFTIAKLMPAAANSGDADIWQSYINSVEDTSDSTAGPGGTPALATAIRATYEISGTLTYMGAGVYTYTYGTDIHNVTTPLAVSFDADSLHRIAIQLRWTLKSGVRLVYNPIYDWVPSGGNAPATREIAMTKSCNECHDKLAIHGGGRVEMKFCVVCHNPGSTDANSGNSVDMAEMTHKIHIGHSLPDGYTIWGHNDGEHDYSHVGYPQDVTNCRKCHTADDTDTPEGDNWKTRPTMKACGSCHVDVNFATGDGHGSSNLVQTTNAGCVGCHSADDIERYHLTENATPNNPGLPADVPNIEYELVSAAVNASNVATVVFRLTADDVAQDLGNLPANMVDPDRYPALMFMYAQPQLGNASPADWTNLGRDAAQPQRIDFDALTATFNGATGEITATIPDAFPAGATLRAVGIQGYFRWRTDLTDTTGDSDVARHAVSAFVSVTGDTARRDIIDNKKCENCHEWFEGHGGNRVWDTRVCAGCHVPNLASGGRELDITHPEANNGMKDMIHGIHGAAARNMPLDFVRPRNGGTHYTFISHDMLADYPNGHVVAYPQSPGNCLACHKAGTYRPEAVPTNAVASVAMLGVGDYTTTAEFITLRETQPHASDLVTSPITAACSSCHDSMLAVAHYEQNGGTFERPRSEYAAAGQMESCALCHGAGRTASVDSAHGL